MIHSRKDAVSAVAIGVLVLFSIYYFLIRPQGVQLAQARSDRSAIEQRVAAAEAELHGTATSVGQPAAIPQSAVAVPSGPELSDLLRQLQAIVTDTGVSLASVSPSVAGANPSGPGGSIQITIDAAGSHAAVQTLLQRLRDLPRLLVVEQVGIDIQPAEPTDHVQIAARVFTMQGPVVPVTPAAPVKTTP